MFGLVWRRSPSGSLRSFKLTVGMQVLDFECRKFYGECLMAWFDIFIRGQGRYGELSREARTKADIAP